MIPTTLTPRTLLATALAAVACLALAPAARAACPAAPLSQPFKAFNDTRSYKLVPAGAFEGGATGWSLTGGAAVGLSNSPFYASGFGLHGLHLPAGSSATSPPICIDNTSPVARTFARRTLFTLLSKSALKIDVLYTDTARLQRVITVGSLADTATWSPGRVWSTVLGQALRAADGSTQMRLRFTPQGGSAWWIDDVYVDPRYR